VQGACCRRSLTGKPARPPWLRWRVSACVPPRNSCAHQARRTELNAVYRRLLKMALEELRLIDEQIGQLDQEMASLLSQHQDAVQRLAEMPGLGVDSAQ
jgi:transposase